MTTVNFETLECIECGVQFQVPESFDETRQEDGKTFYCPNGHPQAYTNTTEDQVQELESKNRELQIQLRQLKCQLLGRVGFKDKIKMWWRGGSEQIKK